MSNDIIDFSNSPFEKIKKVNEYNAEYWTAREMFELLSYKDWRNFYSVIDKAKESCKNSNNDILEHFVDVTKTINMPKGAKKEIDDVMLSRYACYLIIQNADPSKEVVAHGQTYFAYQTRKQELTDQEVENQMRLTIRKEIKEHNKNLAEAAKDVGVKEPIDYAIFQDYGYQGLYGGLKARDIHANKELKKSQNILDHMGSEELAANLFRATQAEQKLRREKSFIKGKQDANKTHYEVGQKVRETIKELGGTMPENLPTAESIKKLEKEEIKKLKSKEDS